MQAQFTGSPFFFKDTATSEIYTLSLHDALPISAAQRWKCHSEWKHRRTRWLILGDAGSATAGEDRKSTRLNSSHTVISYAVFCLKKKNIDRLTHRRLQQGEGLHALAKSQRASDK